MSKTLIHCALLCEAQSIIDFLNLIEDKSVKDLPRGNKLFIDKKSNYLLIISGIGKQNCQKSLEFIYKNNQIQRAINIGIAACVDSSIKIGTLFCTNKILAKINFAPITTTNEAFDTDEGLQTLLVDMEAEYFEKFSKKYCKDIYIFKVVSDYLQTQIPKKEFVKELINNSIKQLKDYL